MKVSFQVKPNSVQSAANHSATMSMHSRQSLTAKPNTKIRQKGRPRTSRRCDEIQWVWRAKRHQTRSSDVLSDRSKFSAYDNDTIYTTDHGMIECVNGRLPTIVVDSQYFFVDGYRVNTSRLGSSLGCDPTDVPSLGIMTPEADRMCGEGGEDTVDGQVEGEMLDIINETNDGKLTIKYPFSPYKCSACWEIMESPKKLVEHMSAKHKDDFIQFSCANCNKSNPKLKGIAIHYGLCTKGLTGRGSRNGAGKGGETVPATVTETSSSASSTEAPDLTTRDDTDITEAIAALHECSVCNEKFMSKSGLGQHIRHKHPCLANERRIQSVQADIERKRAARAKSKPIAASNSSGHGHGVWTDEEVSLLLELESKFKGVKFINKAISEHLKGKTSKQISDKRRALAAAAQKPRTPVVEKSTAEQTVTPNQGSQKGPSQEDWKAAVNLEGGPLVGESAEVLLRTVEGEDTEGCYSSLLDKITKLFACPVRKDKANKRQGGRARSSGRPVGKRASHKADMYRKHQQLYQKDKKALSALVLDGKETGGKCELDPTLVEATYMERFGGVSQDVDLSSYPPAEQVDPLALLKPFTTEEIREAYARVKKDSAAGPDGIQLKTVIAKDPKGNILVNLFNSFLYKKKVPDTFKGNRSILLPKGSEGLEDVNNWRPLTISSSVLRLYTNLLARRVLNSCALNPRQRGFIAASGCSENSFLLSEMIDHAKKMRRQLCVTFLDLAKAFDTVSHKHFIAGLRRFGAPEHFVDVVDDLYAGASTVFQTDSGKTGEIPMTRGVKQGDPLSPLLFNIAMDPLLEVIGRQNNGYKFGPEESDRIESLCYADDNALMTESPDEMNKNLALVEKFCGETGMRLNIKKSATFCITPSGSRSYTVNNNKTKVAIKGERVPVIPPDGCMKYLGSKMSPWVTKIRKDIVAQLEGMVESIGSAHLKPRQKVVLLNHYALARLTYALTQDAYPKVVLEKLDLIVRAAIRRWIKLPECSPNTLFYMSRGEGGMGFPEFSKSIPAQRINMLRGICRSSDSKIRRMTEVMQTQVLVESMAEKAGLKIPDAPKGKVRWRKLVGKAVNKLKVGKAAKTFRHTVSNTWMNPHSSYFSEADYITGMSLRAETYPCKATLARTRAVNDINCRHCHQTVETMGHISGACPKVKDYRIRRHNTIVNCVAEKCKGEGWTVCFEPQLVDFESKVWKPDLVLVKGDKAVVLDPTVVWEAGPSLQRANLAKQCKYAHLGQEIRRMFNVFQVDVLGLAIGARGGWCEQNTKTLKTLGIEDKGFSSHLCRLALKGTMNMARLFMDG